MTSTGSSSSSRTETPTMSKSRTPSTTNRKLEPVSLAQMRRAPTHPGVVLLEEFLKPAKYSQRQAALQLGLSPFYLNQIVQGKKPVSADTAVKLEALTGASAE